MIHADCVRCKGIEDEFPIETTTKWILGLGFPEVIIRTDGECSIVALSRRVAQGRFFVHTNILESCYRMQSSVINFGVLCRWLEHVHHEL